MIQDGGYNKMDQNFFKGVVMFKTIWVTACIYWTKVYTKLSGLPVEKAENAIITASKDEELQKAVKTFISNTSVQLTVLKLGMAANVMKKDFMSIVEKITEVHKEFGAACFKAEELEIVIEAEKFWKNIK